MSDLIQIVDAAVADAARRSGSHLVCKPGCCQCCVGVFPISQQDAARLREGLDSLAGTDPDRATKVRRRTAASLARLDPWFPGDLASGVLGDSEDEIIRFEEFANDEICPVLDPVSGTCDLYAHRPVLCRSFGPPGQMEDGSLAACELCYTQATAEEIARCALNPELSTVEAESNAAFDAAHGTRGETLVAYALRGV